ncbi:hypothetical protein BDV35DRAFT_398550 [Aspergillus flavus]|uniref:Uncharacterized protein n=1 Tax=Aspergillus flavus TaxID=5059 RepID=A0A5N6GF00_ASPFL|nr:hypothetical protein BDV35DRAFT_398550 [Aspergillus flavus]
MIAREDYSGVKNQRIQDIIHDLELDYAKGNIYSRYTSAHGYGIIFYMFVVPSTLYEKFLKSKSDVDIVISHFLNVGLSIGDNATLAGKRIVESVTSRFKEQALTIVNICGTLSIDPCSSKRKRARSQTSTIHAARKDPGGSTRTEPQIEQIQHRNASGTPGSSEVSNIAGTIETHTYKNTSSQTTLSEPYGIQQVPGSANIVTGDTPVSSLISPTEQEAQPTLFMSPGTIRQPHSAAQRVSGTVQHTTSPFNIDSVNAAHLMQNFNITSFANAAELMENFDVTSFDPLTAASLMQSFDLFHPMPDIRYHDNQTYN